MSLEARSAALHKSPLWDAVIDTRCTSSRGSGSSSSQTQFRNSPIFCTFRVLLSKGTTIRLDQSQKINSFSILGVAYIARHGVVKDTREERETNIAIAIVCYCLILPSSVLWFREPTVWANVWGKMRNLGFLYVGRACAWGHGLL